MTLERTTAGPAPATVDFPVQTAHGLATSTRSAAVLPLAHSHAVDGHVAPQGGAPTIELSVEDVDAATGVRVRRLSVPDVSTSSPSAQANQAVIQVLDDLLTAHPEWPTPDVSDGRVTIGSNPVSEWLYDSPALRQWREQLVPTAIALFPVQREGTHLPSGAALDGRTQLVLRDSLDAVGIRTRARVMADIVARNAKADGGVTRSWVSLACGAAVPIFDALNALREHDRAAGVRTHLTLVDTDPVALDFARTLGAAANRLEGRDITLLQRDLVRTIVSRASLVEEIGESSASVVEALGIFEYFTDAACVRLLRNAYQLLQPGGVLVVGNMLADRPQLAFNQRGAGWPRLYPRSVEDLVDLVRRAGLPLDRTTISIPTDGIYAVVDVTRP